MASDKCNISDCTNMKKSRGLCQGCYAQLAALVAKQETTWQELEKLGIASELERRKKNSMIEKLNMIRAAKKAKK